MGRPRKYPEGTTAADRARAAEARLAAEGGARKSFALSGRAIDNLRAIREATGEPSNTALLERPLEEERRRLVGE